MDTKYKGVGKNVHQQLWRFISGGGDANSVIQGYTMNGRVIDVPYGKSGEPIIRVICETTYSAQISYSTLILRNRETVA